MLLLRGLILAAQIVSAQAPERPSLPAPRPHLYWLHGHEALVARARKGDIDLLFVGDSITSLWGGSEVWRTRYAPLKAANFGLGGDTTQAVLWRLLHGELDGIGPKVVVLLIGTNNLGQGNSPEATARGVAAVVRVIRHKLPAAKVLLLGLFPRGRGAGDPFRAKIRRANRLLAALDGKDGVRYLDIGKALLERDGSISPEVMKDSLHPTEKGYRLWADAMDPLLRRMLGPAGAGR